MKRSRRIPHPGAAPWTEFNVTISEAEALRIAASLERQVKRGEFPPEKDAEVLANAAWCRRYAEWRGVNPTALLVKRPL